MLQLTLGFWTARAASQSYFRTRCFYNEARNPEMRSLLNTARMEPTAWHVSEFQCGLLCRVQACASFAFDPKTKQCYTSNINVGKSGLLCGYSVSESRELCRTLGTAYVAYGGRNYTPMQCICGTNRIMSVQGYWVLPSSTSAFNCIDECDGNNCEVKLGFSEPCAVCRASFTACNATHYPNVVKSSICTKAT